LSIPHPRGDKGLAGSKQTLGGGANVKKRDDDLGTLGKVQNSFRVLSKISTEKKTHGGKKKGS